MAHQILCGTKFFSVLILRFLQFFQRFSKISSRKDQFNANIFPTKNLLQSEIIFSNLNSLQKIQY